MYGFMEGILGFTLLFPLGHSFYNCNRTGDTLELALDNCGLANGSLLTAANLKEMDLSELIRANFTEFWISNIIMAHPVEYKGCYVYSSSESQNNPIPKIGNLVDCQRMCDHNYKIYPLYGLYGNKCVCIYKNDSNLHPSNHSCFDNCIIDTLEFCKDTKLIALYKQIRNDNTILQKKNLVKNKCIVRINTTSSSTENCQTNLQYQCKGSTKNGTFLNALENCGKELDHDNTLDLSWRPLFFPTIDLFEYPLDNKQKELKIKICQSLKVEKNHTQLKERNCTDSLPYICKTEIQKTNTSYLRPCLFQTSMTSSPSIKTQLLSITSNNHPSTLRDTSVDTRETTNNINCASPYSYIRDTTLESRRSTESADSGMSNKPLIIGIASAVAALILAVIIIFIVRKRLKRTKKTNQKCSHTVNFQAVSNNTEEDILNHQSAEAYSFAAPDNATLESNQRKDVYALVNKTKQAGNRNKEFYYLATSVSSTSVQSKKKEGRTDIYAVVNKNKNKTEHGEAPNNTENKSNIDVSKIITESDDNLFMHTGYNHKNTYVESKRKPGNCVTHPLSSGTDYDHIDFRGSGKLDELSGAAGPLYDHVAVVENSAGLIYDVRRDVEQHGTDDTYDHALSL